MVRPMLILMFAAAVISLSAQEETPAAGRGGRGGRGGTREFLGLGPAPDTAAAARGEKLYASNCAFCHGEKARGAEGPNLVRSAVVLHDVKGEMVGPTVLKGFPDQGMPAFPNLTEAQLYDISQFLHLQVELVANRSTYKRLNVVTGDAKAGQAFFEGAGGCGNCHSQKWISLRHRLARHRPASGTGIRVNLRISSHEILPDPAAVKGDFS